MVPVQVVLIVLACVFGAALIGVLVRTVLPEHHLSPESRDTIKIAIAIIATITALVLGLLIASAKSSFDSKVAELKEAAATVILLDGTLREYGPDTKDTRDYLRRITVERVRQVWPEDIGEDVATSALGQVGGAEQLEQRLLALSPENDSQRWLKTKALNLNSAVEATRWKVFEQIGPTIQRPLLIVLTCWLVAIFMSFGLFAPFNTSVIAAFFVSALSVAASVYLILALDQPYTGMIKISGTPLRMALHEIEMP